ncbi:MAG: L,D-transpeptidase family protein [Terrimicrobiaceae bacterium]|nr:L,D-transpeptidase family protein [Terrimicrobiaceae bacterium]
MVRSGLTLFLVLAFWPAFGGQLVVSVADDWSSTSGRLQMFERNGRTWTAVAPPWRVLYGASGLAWGRGLHDPAPPAPDVPLKRERDKRAPAGLFEIGKIYTYDRALPTGSDFPFHTITEADAWIDDPTHPDYNRHVRVDPNDPPPWFEKQRMRLNDPPHRWLVEIRHNSDTIIPGAGSAIFFHIQRGPERRSAGCTVMPQDRIVELIRWLRADQRPRYVLLPKAEYLRVWKAWDLPPPEVAAAVFGP